MSYFGLTFDRTLRFLRASFPSVAPVRVRTVRLKDRDGDATFMEGGYWRIRVARDLAQGAAIDTIIHEWAHIIDLERNGWPKNPDNHSYLHRNSWGEVYAGIYRAFHR